jgi:hypothetical protein
MVARFICHYIIKEFVINFSLTGFIDMKNYIVSGLNITDTLVVNVPITNEIKNFNGNYMTVNVNNSAVYLPLFESDQMWPPV